ncbi:hypothetical protein [Abyssalbus ytuae]|uniref:Uncharacterized protein n=1 Tax=Abyssalbus ytuae TaxID=2926907 RepID=A0A9E7D419_9FLAO|nr:hypothetical protein [Abyssalbus ytuae]UOB18429.1 hypothetical protein MQE35_03855 [Abyssalbus ytuae]
MKQILPLIAFLSFIYPMQAQIVQTINSNLIDTRSQDYYSDINKYNQKMILPLTSNQTMIVSSIKDIIKDEYDELSDINISLKILQPGIQNFIYGSSFNSKLGYNSYGYIKKRYPLINAMSPSTTVKNKIIRLRYYKKLKSEKEKISDYLNASNPIPEGERILLILMAMENVINITLENENY